MYPFLPSRHVALNYLISPVSFQTVPADPIKKRVETVGRVQPHVKAKVVDPEGNILPVNQPGELCVAGYLVQKGFVHFLRLSLDRFSETRG